MKILLTNDDSFRSPGIKALYEALSEVAEVTVVAPASEMSAISLAITLNRPLRAYKIEENGLPGWYVDGTPADCVKIGVGALLKEKPDFIFSGINIGSNVGLNANYSGTVAAAIEGAMLGIPSVAVSLADYFSRDFRGSAKAAVEVLKLLENSDSDIGRYELLNVNVPGIPPEELKGIKVTRVSRSSFREVFDHRKDVRDRDYWWMGGVVHTFEPVPDGDDEQVMDGWVAVTPLKVDMTAENTLHQLRNSGWERRWRE